MPETKALKTNRIKYVRGFCVHSNAYSFSFFHDEGHGETQDIKQHCLCHIRGVWNCT